MGTLLKDHLKVVEKLLLARYNVSKNVGHSVNKGTAREFFIKDFLMEQLSEMVGIGQGEILNADANSNESRNQQDIVIYRRDFPKIRFGGEINGFLAESVVATIEVKSNLTKQELKKAIKASHNVKTLKRSFYEDNFNIQEIRPRRTILSFVVAYESTATVKTIQSWLKPLHEELTIPYSDISTDFSPQILPHLNSPTLDGIFILGKGFIFPVTSLLRFNMDQSLPIGKWIFANNQDTNLLLLFITLTIAIHLHFSQYTLDIDPYLKDTGDFSIETGN